MLKLGQDYFFRRMEKGIMFTHIKNDSVYLLEELEAQIVSAILEEKSPEEFLPQIAGQEDYDEDELAEFSDKLISSLKDLGILE